MGGRFGAYVAAVQQCVGRKFREQGVSTGGRVSGPVVIRFDIQRTGAVRTASIQQTSGNLDVDRSSQRAVLDCSPFPPLPPAFERNEATIEFWFEFKK
jgi:TonB family protein